MEAQEGGAAPGPNGEHAGDGRQHRVGGVLVQYISMLYYIIGIVQIYITYIINIIFTIYLT